MAVDLSGDGYPDGVLQETLSGTSPPCFAPNPSGLAYCYYQGTSMASPHVAGAAAILRAHRPSATRQQVKQALIESALDLGAPGKDNLYGYGFLQINSALTRLEEITGGGTAPCVRNAETACLLSNRFEVKVNWQTTTGSGTAKVMSFGGARTESDQSVFYYFFDPANFEMGVKVLNGCGLNNKFWIFVSGLTNQAYTVTVRDTQTGTVKSYSNPLGSYPQTVGDTSALNCSGSSASGEGEVELQFVPVEVLPDEAPLYTRTGQSADAASGSGAGRAPATDPGRPLSPVRLAPEESGPAFGLGPQIMAGKAVTDYGLDILGYWEWSINAGMTNIRADQVTNTRPTTSGPLRLALWATASPITANGFTGYNLGYCDYAPLQGGYHYPSLTCTVPYIPPAAGCYYVSIVLEEYTGGTWYYVDWVATNETFALNGGSCAPPYSDPQILGQVEWSINGGSTYIRANNVKNLGTATSGPLGLSLVATTDPVTGSGTISGSTLGSCSHPALGPGASVPSMICNSAYTPPSPGCYYATVLLLEQVSGTWYYTDLRTSTERYALNGGSCTPTGACVRSANKACLLAGRFEVLVSFQTDNSNGNASVMSFGGQRTESDQSVFYYFFDPANFEMGVKVLDACGINQRFWIFVSGLTNQGYTVTVRDTQTGRTKTYTNPLGTYPITVGDTDALPCT
ncbi:MAG: S8 family peptidase [Thermoanaerobaculia bacterium]|nr:S8 family peptidase [Thermoanaerobaculia bacterium]